MRIEWQLGAVNPWVLDTEAEHRAAQVMHRQVSSAMLAVDLTHVRAAVPGEDGAVEPIVRVVHAGLSDLLSALERSMDDYLQRHDQRAPR